jgi:hypothetical protein
MSFVGRTVRSSAVVRMVPRVFNGSIVCRGAITISRRLLCTVPDTASRSSERIDALFGDSRVIRALSTSFSASESFWHDSALGTVVDRIFASDDTTRVRTIGMIVLTAVAVHSMVFAVLAVPVQTLGWIVRLALLAAGAILASRPSSFAIAWKYWRDR